MNIIVKNCASGIIEKINEGLDQGNIPIRERNFLGYLRDEFSKIKNNSNPNSDLLSVLDTDDEELGVDWYYRFLKKIGYDDENCSEKLDSIIYRIREEVESANIQNKEIHDFFKFKHEIEKGETSEPYFGFYYKFFYGPRDDIDSDLGKRYVQVLRENPQNFRRVLSRHINSQITSASSMDKINRDDIRFYLINVDRKEIIEEHYGGDYQKYCDVLLDSTNNGKNREIIDWLTRVGRKTLEEHLGGIRQIGRIVGIEFQESFKDRVLTKYDTKVRDRDVKVYKKRVEIALDELLGSNDIFFRGLDVIENLKEIKEVCGDDLVSRGTILMPIVEEVLDKLAERTKEEISYAVKDVLKDVFEKEKEILRKLGCEFTPEYIDDLKVRISTLDTSDNFSYLNSLIEDLRETNNKLLWVGYRSVQDYKNNVFHRYFGSKVISEVGKIEAGYLGFKQRLEKIVGEDLF